MTVPMLSTKTYIPPPRLNRVSRPRLIERLDDGLGLGCRLTVVCAPAGFGKTTLLSEWTSHLRCASLDSELPESGAATGSRLSRIQNQVAWLTLEERDNDPARFWNYLVAALGTVQPGIGKNALAFLHAPQPPPMDAVITTLINDLSSVQNLVLVLEDCHTIDSPAIHEGLLFLVEHLPPPPRGMHLVIASRSDPPFPLARLRARGQLNELRVEDLRFTTEETAAFLSQTMGLDLSAEDIAALEARTEGWIAGLQLAALSMRGRDAAHSREFVRAFSGSHRYILDYLAQEVLRRQTAEVQQFLLHTSILGRMAGPLCDAVAATKGSQAILEQLEAANLFLVPLDDHRQWFRYHRLFGDLLRATLQQTQPKEMPELHRRAAAWFARQGDLVEAVGHGLAAGEFEAAAQWVEQCVPEVLWARGEVFTLSGWVQALPGEVVLARPELCLAYAWTLFLSIQFDAIGTWLQNAEEALQRAQVSEPRRRHIRGEMAVMQAMLANFQGDVPGTIALSRQALALVPDENLILRAALAGNLGGAFLSSGDILAAYESFAEALRLYEKTGNIFVTLLASSYLGNTQILLGRLRDAACTYQHALRMAMERGVQQSLGARLAEVGLGRLCYEWNELDAARQHLAPTLEAAERQGDVRVGPGPQMILEGILTLALVHQAQGDVAGASTLIKHAEKLAQDQPSLSLGQVRAARARLATAQGDLATGERWARDCGSEFTSDDTLHPGREFEALTLARILTAQGRPEDALPLLGRLRRAAEDGQRMRTVTEVLVLQAIARQASGDTDAAAAVLAETLRLAKPEGYIRLFLDEGAPMVALLQTGAAHAAATDYIHSLLEAAAAEAFPASQVVGRREKLRVRPAATIPPLIEPLSEREVEVLRLVAEGLSNREIAEELVLAVTTVKKHIGNIFGKLGAGSRTQAVASARKMGLL